MKKSKKSKRKRPRGRPKGSSLPKTKALKLQFLNIYPTMGSILTTCEVLGMCTSNHYRWLRKDRKYAADFEFAKTLLGDGVLGEIWRRGIVGDLMPHGGYAKKPKGKGWEPKGYTINKSDKCLEMAFKHCFGGDANTPSVSINIAAVTPDKLQTLSSIPIDVRKAMLASALEDGDPDDGDE